ncbi:MAG: xanthan lyase [Verrucomicrobium sp.]
MPSAFPRSVLVLPALLSSLLAADSVVLKPHPKALPGIHAPGEVDRPELVPFIVASPTSLPGIVVDETSATLEGEWQYSTHTPPYVGLGYLHDMKAGKGAKSVTFTPEIPQEGLYEVRIAHCYNVRRATNAPVTIHHADGEKTFRINQQEEPAHERLFRSLGTFRFLAGKGSFVKISTDGTDPTKVVIADAVQFLPVKSAK